MKSRKSSIVDSIEQTIAAGARYKRKIWFDNMSPEAQAELNIVKARYKSGSYKACRTIVCRAISAKVAEEGATISLDTVKRWLELD